MKAALTKIGLKAANHLKKHLPKTKQTDIYSPFAEPSAQEIDGIFTTTSGLKIPVYKHHRYSLRKSWSVFGPVAAFAELNKKGLLEQEDKAYLKHIMGYRTITEPFSQIRDRLNSYLTKYHDLFISTDIPDIGRRLLKPTLNEVNGEIEKRVHEHTTLVRKINHLPHIRPLKDGDKVLEIGYTSGGESIFAFEKLGLNAYGIDNFYDASIDATSRHNEISRIVDSKAQFDVGDITTKTLYEEESFSLIYSLSVLEHISDIPASFSEMFRILKPGGFMCHRYDPFFHVSGAHSLATLDSPWAHMRMDDNDLERYIREYRAHEADLSLPWIKSALNRRHTINFIQTALAKSGFKIRLWETEPVSEKFQNQLTPDIISDCLIQNPQVTLADLTSKAVLFVAEKPL